MDIRGRIRGGLLQRGLPEHIADAFILNFQDESGLNPGINEIEPLVPGSRGGFGLYQLTGPRRVAYERFAQERGVDPADVDAQLDFMMMELEGPESRAAKSIFSAPDTGTAAAAIVTDFLRPAEEHRNRRVAKYTGGGAQTMSTNSPQGVPFSTPQEAAPMQQEKVGGLLGALFPEMAPDRADSIRLGINGMLHRPNQGVQRTVETRMAGRTQDRERRQQAAQAQQQANRTAQWLSTQPGGQQYAEAIASGALPAGEALKMWRDASQGQDLSERQQRIQRAMTTLGMTEAQAVKYVDGFITPVTDPVRGGTVLLDLTTNEATPINIAGQNDSIDVTTLPSQTPQSEDVESVGNVRGALGARGVANSIINSVFDAAGGNLPAEQAEEAASNLTNLSTQTMLALSGEWSGRPSNLTRERIEALTVKPNELFTGPNKALIRFKQMRDLIANAVEGADSVIGGAFGPTERGQAQQKKTVLMPLLQEYNAIIEQLEGGAQGATTGQTSSGVQWSIEP